MSKYFSFSEFVAQDDTLPDFDQIKAIIKCVESVLEPLRKAWGRPLTITSGYRSKARNKAIGGATNSDHCNGLAFDIVAGTKADNKALYETIRTGPWKFDQLILEDGGRWVHLGFGPKMRQSAWVA